MVRLEAVETGNVQAVVVRYGTGQGYPAACICSCAVVEDLMVCWGRCHHEPDNLTDRSQRALLLRVHHRCKIYEHTFCLVQSTLSAAVSASPRGCAIYFYI